MSNTVWYIGGCCTGAFLVLIAALALGLCRAADDERGEADALWATLMLAGFLAFIVFCLWLVGGGSLGWDLGWLAEYIR